MANYDAYLLVTVLPPLVITATILVVSYVAWGVSYLQYRRQKERAEESPVEGDNELVEYPGLQCMFFVLQPVLGKGLEAKKTGHKVKVKLHGEKISPAAIPLLVQSLVLAVGLSLAVFITAVIVEDGGRVCNERLDCFAFNYSRQVTPLTRTPITNCSAYSSSEITIRCFSFTVRFVEAIASSGGVLVLSTLSLNLYLGLLFALAKVSWCRRTGLCGLLLLLMIGCFILPTTFLWIIPLALAETKTLHYVNNWESVLVYFYTFVYLMVASTLLLFCVPSYRRDFQRCCSGEERRGYQRPRIVDTDEEEDEGRRGRGGGTSRRRRQGSNVYQVRGYRSGSQGHRPGYYGSVDEHQPRMPSEEDPNRNTPPPPVNGRESGSAEPQPLTGQNSGGIAGNLTVGNEPRSRTQRMPYPIRSVRGKYTLKYTKKGSKRTRRESRGKKHWAEVEKERRGREDMESEEECSTTSAMLEEERGGNRDTWSSSEDTTSGGATSRRRGGGRHQMWGEGKSGTAKIRAALTGDVVEDAGRKGTGSVHTHL